MTTKVYLVGGPEAPKTNSWLAMTNSWEEASRLKAEYGPTAQHKVVTVPPKGSQRHTKASGVTRRVKV